MSLYNTTSAIDLEEYNAFGYYRLSKEDGKCHESDSISNQRKLIHSFVSKNPYINLVGEADDDGYTGTNFERPGFCAVIDAIKTGKANCVIVKDLSRLGREYIGTGKYLEEIFPALNVRFISINDNYDSDNATLSDELVIPFKNVVNESYCRDLSGKLRRQFKVQRTNGEFIGAFACYGYCKSDDDKHKLVIDDTVVDIVKSIFSLCLQGMSKQDIADKLNKENCDTPFEHKRKMGLKYQTGFKKKGQPKWTANTVRSILTNPIYTGKLVQGKRGTPNYKIKKVSYKPESEWIECEDTHEAIVDQQTFNAVQKMMTRDLRKSPEKETIFPLSGYLFCADCGSQMIRRTVSRGNKKFSYYVCSKNKKGKGCTSHSIPQEKVEQIVARAIHNQIELAVDFEEVLKRLEKNSVTAAKKRRIMSQIKEAQKTIEQSYFFRDSLYESLKEKTITEEEYKMYKKKYSIKIDSVTESIALLNAELKELKDKNDDESWIELFKKFSSVDKLSREAVVSLIDNIKIYDNKKIKIQFNFQDEFAFYMKLLNEREAV